MVSKAAVLALTKAKAELTAVKYHNFTSIYAPSPGMRDAEFEESDSNVSVDVKGRLAAHVPFWESIGASPFVLSVLKEGYQFPLISEPPGVSRITTSLRPLTVILLPRQFWSCWALTGSRKFLRPRRLSTHFPSVPRGQRKG